MVGIKGKRVPGRPGRFDPTEPLHMRTRKAAKGSNGTDGSHDEDSPEQAEQRRISNGTTTTRRSSALGPEPPTKRQRTDEASPGNAMKSPTTTGNALTNKSDHAPADQNTSNGAAVEDKSEDEGPERHYYHRFGLDGPPVNRSLADILVSPRELRMIAERESASNKPSTPISDSVVAKQTPNTDSVVEGANAPGLDESFEDQFGPFAAFHSGYRKVAEKDMHYTEGRTASQEPAGSKMLSSASSPSDPNAFGGVNVPALSTDVTPMVTRQGTPATPASGALDETPAGHRTAVLTLGDTTDEEGNDMAAIAPTQETVDEVVDQEAEEEEEEEAEDRAVRKTSKRRYAGGRRRATHANIVVEAAMRRQLELKQIYRQATRAMKACLGEISQITLDELETKEDAHTQATEYEEVLAELDARLARRKEQLYAAQRFNEEQLKQRWHAERDVHKDTCKNVIEEARAQHIASSEYNILRIHRDRLSATTAPAYDTEDEDGIIPRPKAMSYRFKRSDAIDLRYDSRSRFTLETERKVKDLAPRIRMWEALKAYAPEPPELGTGFTVMAKEPRDAAEERQASIRMTKRLAAIAEQYAPKPPPPPPSALTAKDLAPLNALAELAGRPSLQMKHFPVNHQYPPRPSPAPAMSVLEQEQSEGLPRQSPYQPVAPSLRPAEPMRYPMPAPYLQLHQSAMPKQENSQGMGYFQQSPRQPARSLPEMSQGIGYPHLSPRQTAHQPPMSMPKVQQGTNRPHQSPRQQIFAPMSAYPSFKRSDSEVASQSPLMPRQIFSEHTMGPPPTPYQATAPPLRSPLLHRFDISPTAASMGGARGADGMHPLAAKTSQAQEPQRSKPRSRSPSLPSLPGVHPDRINIIAEANNMTGSKPPTSSQPYTGTNTSCPPPGPPTLRTQPNTTNMHPPSIYTQPTTGMIQPPLYTPRTQAMQHNIIAPGPQQMYPAPQPHHAQQAPPHQWTHATNQNSGYLNGHVPDPMPSTVRRGSIDEWRDEPTDHPWQQPRTQSAYPAHYGHALPPRPPVTEARTPAPPRLPARPPSSGNGMSTHPRNSRRTQKPSFEDRGGVSRRKWTRESEDYKDRVRAASLGHHMARFPSPAPEPARRASTLDGQMQFYAGGNRVEPPPFEDPLLRGPPPFGAMQQGWSGPPPPMPTAAPVDHFARVPARRQETWEEKREREEHEELVRLHKPGTFFPRRWEY